MRKGGIVLNALFKILDISIFTDNTDISMLCKPYMQSMTEFAIKMLMVDPGVVESMVGVV